MKNYNHITRETSKMVVAKAEADKAAREAAMAAIYEPKEVETDVEVDVDESAACDEVEEAAVEAPAIEPSKNEPLIGVTTTRLNIRETPNVEAGNIVAVVAEGTVVMIDGPNVNDEWLKIYTESGVEGYCMSKFVKINK